MVLVVPRSYNLWPKGRTPKGNGDWGYHNHHHVSPGRGRRAERRKAMETPAATGGTGAATGGVAEGQNAERQWRPFEWSNPYPLESGWPKGRTPKGNGDSNTTIASGENLYVAEGQNAERQWRRAPRCSARSRSWMVAEGQNAERQWRQGRVV